MRTAILRRGVIIVGVALALTLAGCSSCSKPGASSTIDTGAPKTTAALLQRALRAQIAGNLTQAEPDFLEVIRRDPGNKFAHYDLGLIYQTQAKFNDAEHQYRFALTVDTKFGPALYNLAILRTAAKDTTGAIALYRRTIAANAKDANARFNLGLLLREAGQTNKGNAEVQTAVNLDASLPSKAMSEGVLLAAQYR